MLELDQPVVCERAFAWVLEATAVGHLYKEMIWLFLHQLSSDFYPYIYIYMGVKMLDDEY